MCFTGQVEDVTENHVEMYQTVKVLYKCESDEDGKKYCIHRYACIYARTTHTNTCAHTNYSSKDSTYSKMMFYFLRRLLDNWANDDKVLSLYLQQQLCLLLLLILMESNVSLPPSLQHSNGFKVHLFLISLHVTVTGCNM